MDYGPVVVFLIAVVALIVLTGIVLNMLPPPRPRIQPATNIRVKFVQHIT
jgi:hypothetical protein